MIWTDAAVKMIQIFFWEITAGAAGSMIILFLMLTEKIPRWRNSRLKLVWLKLSALFFLIPMAAPIVLGRRSGFSENGAVAFSDFARTATVPMQKFYLIAGITWMTGMGVLLFLHTASYYRYRNILKGTVEVTNERIKELARLHIDKAEISNVHVKQSDLLGFPLTRGIFRKEIILPLKEYTEKELHMILEHECSHVKYHDIFWKKIVLLASFLHCGNPFSYIMLKMLELQMEIECDIRTCERSEYFTMKEYGFYLAGMPEEVDSFFLGGGSAEKVAKGYFQKTGRYDRRKKIPEKNGSCQLYTADSVGGASLLCGIGRFCTCE